MPENTGGFTALKFSKTHERVDEELATDHPIEMCRYQVANCYMGRIGLINSGGASGANDFADATRSKTHERVDEELATDHPIEMCRYQVANCYMGRIGLINSGGASGANDFDATRTAVINKRAGGMGLISGRKAFQRPMDNGVELLNTIQDVYLCPEVTVA